MAFAGEGMNVVLADIERSAAEKVAAEVQALGTKALPVAVAVSVRADVQTLANRAWDEFGSVHVPCNNAGMVSFQQLIEAASSDWDWTMGVNL